MIVYFDIVNLTGNYMLINELKNPNKEQPF
jgi:hypothetical protein